MIFQATPVIIWLFVLGHGVSSESHLMENPFYYHDGAKKRIEADKVSGSGLSID